MSVCERIDRLRRVAKIDVTEFSDRLGISRSTYYYRLHSGEWPEAELETVADLLGVPVASLVYGESQTAQISSADVELLSGILSEIFGQLTASGLDPSDVGNDWISRAALTAFVHCRGNRRIDSQFIKNLTALARRPDPKPES